ncbi:hypothetical protein SAMN04488025_1097 [Planifilum fulgidum]|uniref:Uncharacterized protein n=1 Tax=Planifilum fulgidum TaxID=201973 RepID=A0A1I2MMR2_9BACL|nr:hypothetical protein SAMN04488025_1097 [Planifilum fulgidum]
MGKLSVGEISSLIPEIPKRRVNVDKEDSPVHKNWDPVTRSALVILWGLLVYPRLDPDMRKRGEEPIADRNVVYEHFHEHIGSREKWEEILDKLKQYDYIRYLDGDKLTAGTRLLTTVDAAKMYKVYRTSVLVRRLNQLSTHTSED